jgi:tRNA (guanine37-N1)-methyltransferase
MRFDILTLFPAFFRPFLEEGILGRAVKRGLIQVGLTPIRDFARDAHKTTDDRPYGGGDGMVMKAGPIVRALRSVKQEASAPVILLSPQGRTFDRALAWELAEQDHLILICGRYEGVDDRVRAGYVNMEVSIGDYILSGGEPAALVMMDAVSRLIPGVLGGERSNQEDSFEEGLLEYPHYTRPRDFEGREVPEILLSGDHERIRVWRRTQSLKRTLINRPDLLETADLDEEGRHLLLRLKEEMENP